MTSRPRPSSKQKADKRSAKTTRSNKPSHQKRRRNLLETLEPRQLLAGPQLVGIQPNEGDLIVEGSVRNEAPRALTFRFDEVQQIDDANLSGIQLQRAGGDGLFGTADDVTIQPGLVTLGDNAQNEVVVRFADSLPDDLYRATVFGVDSPSQGIEAIRNVDGESFQPSIAGQGAQSVNFELRLGALIEAVVPQPVVRTEDGSLVQNRNEIVVYFNEDPLFVEDSSATGTITVGAQQIAVTGNLVDGSFDDTQINFAPSTTATRVAATLDPATRTITVSYPTGITTVSAIAVAIDTLADFSASVVAGNPNVPFVAPAGGAKVSGSPTARSAENPRFYQLLLTQDTVRTTDDALYFPETVVYDEATHTARLIFADDINNLGPDADGNAGVGIGGGTFRLRIGTAVDDRIDLILPPTTTDLTGIDAGETLTTAFDVGVLDNSNGITSLVLSESISPQPFDIELPGGNDDPGRREIPELAGGGLVQFVNAAFGDPNSESAADVTDGITEIAYNFQGIFASNGGNSFLNQITQRQRTRVREALDLWSRSVGVQFRETVDSGITFAVGDPSVLPALPDTRLQSYPVLNASLRIDPTFAEPAIVFSNQANFGTAFGEDFSRKTAAGIGFLLGLEQAPGLPLQTLMTLSPQFLNASINSVQSRATPEDINAFDPFYPDFGFPNPFEIPSEQQELQFLEPTFPGNYDTLHGQFIHRPDSNDIDLFRFVVDLDDADRLGTLTAETFAERLPDSSSLDSTLTLFQETKATAVTSFGVGVALSVEFESLRNGKLGNNTTIEFVSNDGGAVSVTQKIDAQGNAISNGLIVNIPRSGVSADAVVAAINNSPLSAGLLTGTVVRGGGEIVGTADLNLQPVQLTGGDVEQLRRNDDYFSEDSRIIASLGEGTYYIGVAASGNDTYDPTIPESGFGGLTQGRYDLSLRFEPQVDEVNVIRDTDDPRTGVPGTPIDGDGDGLAGGVHNFWFQTRPENRLLSITGDGTAITNGQTLAVTGANGVTQTFQFVTSVSMLTPGNIPVIFDDGSVGAVATPADGLVEELRTAINSRPISETGVRVLVSGQTLEFTGEQTIALSGDFQGGEAFGRNIFVDKTAGPNADGSLDNPFNNIAGITTANAFGSAISGDIVRIVGNGGLDGDITTEEDNFSYQVGVSNFGGFELEDGRNLEVPQGVTAIFDAGAIVKLRSARIAAGSSTLLEDRSQSVIQVFGTPRLVQLSPEGSPITTTLLGQDNARHPDFNDGSVIFTSIQDPNADAATVQSPLLAPEPGDWGGLVFRRDLDISEGRFDLEDEGIFLRHVNHAQIRYGGTSDLLIDSVQQLVNPIQIFDTRPTVSFSEISFSADSAISASPNSFEETSYLSPRFQQAGSFNPDYARIGPDFHNNVITNNSVNGLFIRIETSPELPPQQLSLSARFDDVSVVHYVAENIFITGTPGGSIQDGIQPDLVSASFQPISGGTLDAGTYNYRLTFVDAGGFESLASEPSSNVVVGADSSIRVANLQPIAANSDYVSRRLYRLDPATNQYFFIADLDATDVDFLDNGTTSTGVLDLTRTGIRGRLDASLVIDPGAVLKFRGTRIELGQGTQLIAEGTQSRPVIFTSWADDRFGAGGTFDTTNDANSPSGSTAPDRGDWSGIYASPNAFVSLDNATIAYGGGVSLITGGQSRGFAALELHQADARVTNSQFQFNEDGQDGSGPVGRFGRLGVAPSTIFVQGSQPTIVGNEFVDNRGSIIDIDVDSMTDERIVDLGRQTGDSDRFASLDDNYGPLIRLNRYENVPALNVNERQISGLEIRGGQLTTASVWDDTDIVHLLFDTVDVGNLHSVGGLRLISRDDESLVVKLDGEGSPFSARSGTGISASGTRSSIEDRIGGSVQIVGLPGAPVILTSFADDTAGAGLTPDGQAFTDTNGDSFNSRPEGNDWRSILLDEYSNDRNFDYILERNITSSVAPGLNGLAANSQVLGDLAPNVNYGDDQHRLGFEVEGFLSSDDDVDTYSFTAEAGTRIWVDVDKTSFTLDSVIEILDADGNVIARSDNSFDEIAGTPLQAVQPILGGTASSLEGGTPGDSRFGAGGLYEDYASTNPRDAGISLSLPGNRGTRSVFFFRIRSASQNPNDASGGITNGGYRFQLRLREAQEFPGSIVRHADIRYANHGIHVRGLMADSPLLGDAQENESVVFSNAEGGTPSFISSNNSITSNPLVPGQRAQYIGDLLHSKNKTFSVGGELSNFFDIDFYQIDVLGGPEDNLQGIQDLQTPTVFDIDYADGFSRPNTSLVVFYDADGEFGDQTPQLVFFGESSNVLDDQASTISTDSLDILTRGSISTGDPLIGPVSLTRGTYYVGVVADGAVPDALNSPTVRREPIESLVRIFDDHVETNGGSTAVDPIQPSFTDPAELNPGWTITTDRALDVGHQITSTFNRSRTFADSQPSIQFEQNIIGDTILNFQDLTAGDPTFSLSSDPNVGDAAANTSNIIPHTKVFGTTANEVVDIYRFEVFADGSQVILDVDNGFNPSSLNGGELPEGTPEGIEATDDPNSVDLQLHLLDATGNIAGFNTTSLATDGALGSARNRTSFFDPSTSTPFTNDPYIETTLATGVYFVAVSPEGTTYDPVTGSFTLAEAERPASGSYELNVSVQNHPSDSGDIGNQSYRFDRSVDSGTLASRNFDLSGYSAGDQPRFYFNYFFNRAAGDDVTIQVRQVVGEPDVDGLDPIDPIDGADIVTAISPFDFQLIPSATGDNVWRQGIISLEQFAGMDNLSIEFVYTTDSADIGPEGLYLDDLVVGFAERGELITNSAPGVTTVSGANAGFLAGEYQLEVRPSTAYGSSVVDPLFGTDTFVLTQSFDTNDRQIEGSASIIAPHADQLSDGDSFVLSDGVRSVRFEFDLIGSPAATAGSIRIPYQIDDPATPDVNEASTQSQIADAIRDAINLPVVRSIIEVSASDSTGSATGGFGDNQVAISGTIVGDFNVLNSPNDLPESGTPLNANDDFKLPVVFTSGTGDSNVTRSQSMVIVENNRISDVRGIGIWSETSDRGVDPEDPFNFSVSRSPVGTTNPGAVRNLPTLNNSVIGGEAPGIVVRNNTIDQAGYAGVKVEGDIRPYVIDSSEFAFEDVDISNLFGDLIVDGLAMTIDANGVRVVFEFDDINGDAAPLGSGTVDGDGVADGHVPIHYRRSSGVGPADSRYEVMAAIISSIQGSILVTNGIVPLIEATLGTSLQVADPNAGTIFETPQNGNAAVYLEGATNIQYDTDFQDVRARDFGPFDLTGLAAVFDAPQPVSRIVNNTIYGNDGTESTFVEAADDTLNDLISQAVNTRAGSAHTGPYVDTGTIAGPGDVDLFQVELGSGDRLIADIDTLVADGALPAGVDTTLRVFNSNGVEVAINEFTVARAQFDLGIADSDDDGADASTVDPFIDFTATIPGTYYVGVSSAVNAAYDPNSISGRGALADASAFDYTVGLEVYAPRTFVLSIDDLNNNRTGNNQGSRGSDLIGTSFTITQIADLSNADTPSNQQTFTFSGPVGGQRLGNGDINIPIPTQNPNTYFVPETIAAIANAISGAPFVTNPNTTNPPLPNHTFGNGPDGLSGPIGPVTALGLGGPDGNGPGLELFNPFFGRVSDGNDSAGTANFSDFTGFGYNRSSGMPVFSVGLAGTSSLGDGTTELYVYVENAAEITISPEAAAAGLRLDPVAGNNIDQLIPETGILFTGGSSGTALNNVLSNLHQGIVLEETKFGGFFPGPADIHPKPAIAIATANTFQHIEPDNNVFRTNMTQPFSGNGNIGIIDGPSNINATNDDFNVTLGNEDPLFVNAAGGDFVPTFDTTIIDSSVNAVTQRDRLTDVLQSVGLSMSNVLAPNRDINGVLRADDPNVAPPPGLGSQIFKDRGSTERADFVGPVALALNPADNESVTGETDPFVSVIQLPEGIYDEFRIQLRDTGDASDPFNGQGIDDNTVVVSVIDGLRSSGANVTLFENDQLLTEGVDYSFGYDPNQNVITLTPLAGIWRSDRSYRALLNNQDRSVVVVPSAADLNDGDQLSIVDSRGGELVFEFETGYSLFAPQPITLQVPAVGAGAGGLLDGDTFQIDDGVNPPVTFEFNNDALTLPGTVPVPLEAVPAGVSDLSAYLGRIAAEIFAAIQRQVDAATLDVDARVIGTEVIIGADRGATAVTSGSALDQPARTLAVQVPSIANIADGDQIIISDGQITQGFEFTTDGNVAAANNLPINIAGLITSTEIATAMREAINDSPLMLGSAVAGIEADILYLNLPAGGTVDASDSQLTVVGLSRTPVDGETITITPSDSVDGETVFTLELDNDGVIDATIDNNAPVAFTRSMTADEINLAINNAIDALPAIAGLNTNDIQQVPGGQLSIGGLEGLEINASGPSLAVTGEPSVAGRTGIEVFGPLLLSVPADGGRVIIPGAVFSVIDNQGVEQFFEFRIEGGTALPNLPDANFIDYTSFDSAEVIRDAIIASVNANAAGVDTEQGGPGIVSFGRIEDGRVNTAGRTIDGVPVPGLLGSSVRRGTVADGEVLTITQADITVNYEFEAAVGGNGVMPGNVRVAFTAASTAQDIAQALAAAIDNNKNGLLLDPVATDDGIVELNDVPGTIVDVSAAPTLSRFGVPGGATPVRILPSFGSTEVKRALINAINSINQPGQPALTTLVAEDRGGNTLFVSGAVSFGEGISNFALPAISDLSGNPLEPNRNDDTTQFTYLLPTIGLDYGDAPDPVAGVAGRYPTSLEFDGARHIVGGGLTLGTTVDTNLDGIPTAAADGDDATLVISETGTLFTISNVGGVATVNINTGTVAPLTRDGDTIVIDTGVAQATLEFDTNGRFDEDNFAISPTNPSSAASIAEAIRDAIAISPLNPASVTTTSTSVTISGDDEDGVQFLGTNGNIINAGIATPIEVTVTGSGVLEAWIDFNADGDWTDPGEQIIPMDPSSPFAARRDELCPVGLTGETDNNFGGTGMPETRTFCIIVPPTTTAPIASTETYARFRVSATGGLSPTGLALSGEVEDYALQLTDGLPPTVSDAQANQTFNTNEDTALVVVSPGGLLSGIVDPNGDPVSINPNDVTVPGTPRELFTVGGMLAGELNLSSDGSFDFTPAAEFNGVVQFTAGVTDGQLNSPRPITVTITVDPINDMPERGSGYQVINRTIAEDAVQIFTADELIFNTANSAAGPIFVAGPMNELGQGLIFDSVSSVRGMNMSELGGTLVISSDGTEIQYTPPQDYDGAIPDTFNYSVVDVPTDGTTPETSSPADQGFVEISITAVNDAPIARDDNFQGQEDQELTIPILSATAPFGILNNDSGGPAGENQTVSLVTSGFPMQTTAGGNVRLGNGNTLIYTPRGLFSGIDTFQYSVTDSDGEIGTATVSINLSNVNNNPIFEGVNGAKQNGSTLENPLPVNMFQREESKTVPNTETFDLNTWFSDPENAPLTYAVISDNPSVATVSLGATANNLLRIEYPSFGFGTANLTITATDPEGASTTVVVTANVQNTEDAPTRIDTLDPLSGVEDQIVTADLRTIFNDPDNTPLTYSVLRLGTTFNPTPAQIANHPLIQSITFVGDQLRIELKPNQSGTVDLIEIAASDGLSQATDSFSLNIASVPDAPVAGDDAYFLPIGSSLTFASPAGGLLRNDVDPDGDAISIQLETVAGSAAAGIALNADGTFTYQSPVGGSVGDQADLTYRIVDSTGRVSNTATVTFTLNQSRYQNPIASLREDVTADGNISALDALRVLNFLQRRSSATGGTGSVPVSTIVTAPPDFLDVNGDGQISAFDALLVINHLREVNNAPSQFEPEFIAPADTASTSVTTTIASSAITSSIVSPDSSGMPSRQLELVESVQSESESTITTDQATDKLLASGMSIDTTGNDSATDWLSNTEGPTVSADEHDEALASVFDEIGFDEI
ncbi:hypothetical protein LF1_03180 [Rubripirellula obstinata]|uniref:Dockerin domain-containing protein n=1 Tax=Rubripirellula obstinata TaxID=406547 RepID=A0A5B1C9J7_9BACT|nr:tandem-95 repeat protein [Rubripirellula obstinata]KAA1257828.1 hypothetical protein LF1_03180 [Rubripirellula obstinata]